ncbi:MAG: gamma-glutamyltransferase, partial [Candidatus Promineofilum sp.]|nr:gamma-glutamyltransferase [Promineifilum sp.]
MTLSFSDMHFPSRRAPVVAGNGLVATSQPLAAQAGLAVMQAGGNAIDAAVATVATLCVVEPCSTGIGGDAFALIWSAAEGRLFGLNASGPAPAGLT